MLVCSVVVLVVFVGWIGFIGYAFSLWGALIVLLWCLFWVYCLWLWFVCFACFDVWWLIAYAVALGCCLCFCVWGGSIAWLLADLLHACLFVFWVAFVTSGVVFVFA